MEKVALIDPTTEDRIAAAIGDAAKLVSEGLDPDSALTKVAEDQQLPAGFIPLLCSVYNTGRTLAQLRSSNEVMDKLSNFTLAKSEVVMDRLYPQVKAASFFRDTALSDEYRRAPEPRQRVRDTLPGLEKVAEAKPPVKPAPQTREQAVQEIRRGETKLAAQRLETTGLSVQLQQAEQELVDYFRGRNCVDLGILKQAAQNVLGDQAGRLLDHIATRVPKALRQGPVKQASWDREAAPYRLVEQTLKIGRQFQASRQASARLEQETLDKKAEVMRPFVQRGRRTLWEDSGEDLLIEKQAVTSGDILGGAIGGNVTPIVSSLFPERSQLLNTAERKLEDPTHEAQLRSISSMAMVNDLLAHDPGIQAYPAEDVLDAYNQMAQLAPTAITNRMLASTLLGKYLSQGNKLDTFDLDQLASLEGKLRLRQQPAIAGGQAVPAQGRAH